MKLLVAKMSVQFICSCIAYIYIYIYICFYVFGNNKASKRQKHAKINKRIKKCKDKTGGCGICYNLLTFKGIENNQI